MPNGPCTVVDAKERENRRPHELAPNKEEERREQREAGGDGPSDQATPLGRSVEERSEDGGFPVALPFLFRRKAQIPETSARHNAKG